MARRIFVLHRSSTDIIEFEKKRVVIHVYNTSKRQTRTRYLHFKKG